jgi:hypothetical protein
MWISEVKRTWPGTLKHGAVEAVSEEKLRGTVETLAYPRDYEVQRSANEKARDWLREELRCYGYEVRLQGACDNVIANPRGHPATAPVVLLGAHYDTVPTTPGADDNGSAIAVCLEAARVLAQHEVPVRIAIFNREEVGSEGAGLIGSSEYVAAMGAAERQGLMEAHIFEMVGYFTSERHTQSKPGGLPIRLRDTGDFIGLLSNARSNRIASRVMRAARAVGTRTPLISLKIFFGLERRFKDLLRSDHTPFWNAELPALMWTDTSEFRNPHYHLPSDKPDTLNYAAMADVARIVVGHVVRTMKK